MIKISIDEGAAYDMLCILQIKSKKEPSIIKTTESIKLISSEISYAIGSEKHTLILYSDEYSNLYRANEEVFNLIDQLKKDPSLGLLIDQKNYARYLCKKGLMQRFFPDKIQQEIKLGY